VSSGRYLGTAGKLSVRRGAWALFCGIWTYGGKVMDFQKNYEL